MGTVLRSVSPSNASQYLPGNFRFTGVDAYELTTDWSDNYGCGSDLSDAQIGALFQSLGPDAVVRTWFFQQLATNKYTGKLDWAGLDRAVQLADQYGVHLIATLGNQDGTCDDNVWKGPGWYSSGYRSAAPGYQLSYLQWVSAVATRYRNDPAILAWEPVNEPRPDTCTNTAVPGEQCWSYRTCPSPAAANRALRGFFDQVGSAIRAADPNHLISDGAPPVQSCGALAWSDLQYLDASPGIDLMSFHDYSGAALLPGVTATAYQQMATTLSKPVFAGENGGLNAVAVGTGGGQCPNVAVRASEFGRKISSEMSALPALTGWLFWNALDPPSSDSAKASCAYQTYAGDPLLGTLAAAGRAARGV